jgi:hypothetical protein
VKDVGKINIPISLITGPDDSGKDIDLKPRSNNQPSPIAPADSTPLAQTRRTGREFVEYALLGILFLACSISYPVNINNYSFYPVEWAAVVYILWRLVAGRAGRALEKRDWYVLLGVAVVVALSGLVWFIAVNWRERTNLLFAWVLGAIFLASIFQSVRAGDIDGRVVAVLFVIAALPNSAVATFQHFTETALRGKDWLGWSWRKHTYPVTGLFGYANEMAVYQYWPLILSAGLMIQYKRLARVVFGLLAVWFGVVLYWTMARVALVTAGAAFVLILVFMLFRSRKTFALLVGSGMLFVGGLALWILPTLSTRVLSDRFALWGRTIKLILKDPYYLGLGYFSSWVHSKPVFWLPHNVFLFAWMYVGWGGVLLLGAFAAYLIFLGWRHYSAIRQFPLGATLWIGLGVFLLINGMASLYLHEVYHIFAFIIILALWWGLRQEILEDRTPTTPPPASEWRFVGLWEKGKAQIRLIGMRKPKVL